MYYYRTIDQYTPQMRIYRKIREYAPKFGKHVVHAYKFAKWIEPAVRAGAKGIYGIDLPRLPNISIS